MLKRKLIALNTAIILGAGSVFAIPAVKAAPIHEIKDRENDVAGNRTKINGKIENANQEIAFLQEKKDKLNVQIGRIGKAIEDNKIKITETKGKISDTKSDIETLKEDVSKLQDRIEKRNEILKDRAISFQETGGDVSYLEVLLGSSSFRDFVNRVGAVATIVEADREIVEQHEADKAELEEKKAEVENKLSDLTDNKLELEGMMAQIKDQQKQAKNLKAELTEKQKLALALKANLQQKDAVLAAQQKKLQEDMRLEAKRQAAIKAAEERAAKARSVASKSPINNSPRVSYKGSGARSIVVNAGNKYIGNSVYVFGGGRTASDIANGRFDCSAFTSWAFAQAGIKLGAHTDIQKHAGRQITLSQALPGDLVFFDTYKKDGHVGIYVGGGKFIGSQSSTGIAIANMSSGYYAQKFNGRVVRIIE
ncbi:coiled-coil domain-containing protein [Peribacillus glennii]|uniref:coiled-coil domain-containing protein n=1 Tax=Peribacillus glennii TaxID=2303991 RepID=UPI002D782CBE|nr:NlpC/P60 family protein [Peribacillus glennii]